MCFSATVSYGASAVLIPSGLYALQQARRLPERYWVIALVPLLFGIQQAFEGRVWQLIEVGEAGNAVPFALGFLFFSHFVWLWLIPLASHLVEPEPRRRRLFLAVAVFGFLAGGLVYFALLLNPDWLSVATRGESLIYRINAPVRGSVSIGIPPSALYALIVLTPLLASSHRHLQLFGVLIIVSILLASAFWAYAFVSVWCFFAAALSAYLVLMLRNIGAPRPRSEQRQTA